MIVLAREVFVCKCSTDVPRDDPTAGDQVRAVRWLKGDEAMLANLDSNHHNQEHVSELRQRLLRGEYWMVGELEGRIVTYTWLHKRSRIDYPYLPGCSFEIASDVGYGYDAWTPPDLRGGGLRRRGFLEELHVLRTVLGCAWETSFFVKHQLEGATRSLGKVGIDIVPLWRARLERDRKLSFENLRPGDGSASPATA